MNILFYLTRYPGIGGIENVTNIVASELIKEHSITILSHWQQNAFVVAGINLYQMPNKNVWQAKENYEYAYRIVSENKFDLIVYQDSYAPTERIVCDISETFKVPLYVFEHNSPLFIYNKRDLAPITTVKGFFRRLLHPYLLNREISRKRFLLDHSQKYILLSKQFIPEFCNLIGLSETDERIAYINNPVAPISLKNRNEKENVILCVSRLVKEKCIDKMIYIWNNIYQDLLDWQFVIVGDGPEKENLKKLVRKLNVSRVNFVGYADPSDYYQRAKIFWLTSKFEGWGLTLIEAMQRGCVPVAYKTFSSIVDIIDDGENGYLVAPYNTALFSIKTKMLAQNESILSELSERCRKKVECFSLDCIVEQWKKELDLK